MRRRIRRQAYPLPLSSAPACHEGTPMPFAANPVAAPVAALLEIGRDPTGNLPSSLISAAYRASRQKPVMLVLDEITPREIDAVLDPIVTGSHRDHRGVIYASVADDRAVLAGATAASRVF